MTTLNLSRLALAACTALAVHGAWAQGGTSDDARAQYQRERAACLSGQTTEDRATCLREAGAAYNEARRGGLTEPSPSQARHDALDRCNVFQTEQDRRECVARMRSGEVSGSVEGGGILREKSFVVPAPASTDAGGTTGTGPSGSQDGSAPRSTP
jgi:hypothetical protein